MWTVVYMAQQSQVDDIQKRLTGEGILVKLRQVTPKKPDSFSVFEVLVPEGEAEEAHEIILEKGC